MIFALNSNALRQGQAPEQEQEPHQKLTDEKIPWITYQVTGKWAAKQESGARRQAGRGEVDIINFIIKFISASAVGRWKKKRATEKRMCQNAVGKRGGGLSGSPSSKYLAFIPLSKSQTKLSVHSKCFSVFPFFPHNFLVAAILLKNSGRCKLGPQKLVIFDRFGKNIKKKIIKRKWGWLSLLTCNNFVWPDKYTCLRQVSHCRKLGHLTNI